MVHIVDVGPECFVDTDISVISYKGDNYYKACDAFVAGHPDGGSVYCVKRTGHPGNVHESYEGATRSD